MSILYLGDFPTGETIYIPFHTFSSDDPSASMTITGLAASDIEIYKDGGTTQRSSDAGYALLDTDGIDFDGITGIHGISIDTSDNTDAGFYAAGSDYWVVISSITLDGATINFIAAIFSIDNRGLLRPTTAARTLDVSATGEAGLDFDNIKDATGAHTLTNITVPTVTANTDMRGTDNAATEAKQDIIDTVVDAIKAITDALPDSGALNDLAAILTDTAVIGALGAGLTAVPWNSDWDAEVQSEVQDALVALHLDHLLAVTYDPASKPGVADALLNELIENDAGVSRYTANALEEAPTGGSAPTAAEIVDEWETQSQADPTGFHVNAMEVNGTAQTGNDNGADINTLLTRITAAVALASICTEARLAELDAANIPADIDAIPTTAMRGTDSAATEAKQDIIDTNVDTLITRVTAAVATAAALSTHDSKLDTVDDFLDTEIAAILADTVLMDKWVKNRIAFTGSSMILYDDDNTTPLLTWTLSEGSTSVSGPYNRAKAT